MLKAVAVLAYFATVYARDEILGNGNGDSDVCCRCLLYLRSCVHVLAGT